MVIDAIPKIEQKLYIDDDLDSFMFADYDLVTQWLLM